MKLYDNNIQELNKKRNGFDLKQTSVEIWNKEVTEWARVDWLISE